jgi:hypothetical protein
VSRIRTNRIGISEVNPDRTLCPICLQECDIYADGTIEVHYDTNVRDRRKRCPGSVIEAPAWTERTTRPAVDSRSGGICEYCRQRRASDKHHRKNRSQMGGWNPANIIDLCRGCHHDVTTNPNWAWQLGLVCKPHENPEEHPVIRKDGTMFQPTSLVVMEPGKNAR